MWLCTYNLIKVFPWHFHIHLKNHTVFKRFFFPILGVSLQLFIAVFRFYALPGVMKTHLVRQKETDRKTKTESQTDSCHFYLLQSLWSQFLCPFRSISRECGQCVLVGVSLSWHSFLCPALDCQTVDPRGNNKFGFRTKTRRLRRKRKEKESSSGGLTGISWNHQDHFIDYFF